MQWVTTTGRTVEDAKEQALDALGIDEADLEFEVVADARSSLFGLWHSDARIRARVRPTRPRPKIDRRNRRVRKKKRRKSDAAAKSSAGSAAIQGSSADRNPKLQKAADTSDRPAQRPVQDADQDTDPRPVDDGAEGGVDPAPNPDPAAGREAPTLPTTPPAKKTTRSPGSTPKEQTTMSDISIDEQEPTAVDFLEGLLDAFGADATVASERVDDDTVEIEVTGDDLGLLVGPRGNTLQSLQELTRTAVAQQHSGRLEGRLRVDVAGYRARRKEALVRFATEQSERVRETGTKVALEPMSPPDRKIVHDTVNDLDGVRTESRGEDRRRHVVILPDD